MATPKEKEKARGNLSTPEGRKQVLRDIIDEWRDGDANASDAKGALQLLTQLEGDVKSANQEALKADPYSVMKVFLRAEGLTAIESLRKNLSDNDIAEGVAKVLGAVKLQIKWGDKGVGRFLQTYQQEVEEKKETVDVVQAQGVVGSADVQDDQGGIGGSPVDEPKQDKGDTA